MQKSIEREFGRNLPLPFRWGRRTKLSRMVRVAGVVAYLAGVNGFEQRAYANLVLSGSSETTQKIKNAYDSALKKFNELELEQALSVVDELTQSLVADGQGHDPTLSALYVMRAALLYSTSGDEAKQGIQEALAQAIELNEFIEIPPEMRSEGLVGYLDDVKGARGRETIQAMTHVESESACQEDITFQVLSKLPEGGQVVLYWRKVHDPDYAEQTMEVFANVASATVPLFEHGDDDLEYFFVSYDADDQPAATRGTRDSPIALKRNCSSESTDRESASGESKDGKREKNRKFKPEHGMIKLGMGTGAGLSHGRVDLSWSQYFPDSQNNGYGAAEAACAVARWWSQDLGELPNRQSLYGSDPNNVASNSAFGQVAADPALASEWAQAYDPSTCNLQHEVDPGLAITPFHLAPELIFSIGKRLRLGLTARLQVVTGSRVWGGIARDFDQLTSEQPIGTRLKVAFPWTIGLTFSYLLGKDGDRVRPYIGGYGGYGMARFMIKMRTGNDRNGNSVPDEREQAYAINGQQCYEVFPFKGSCTSLDAPDHAKADRIKANASKEARVDTLGIGPGFVGLKAGAQIEISRYVGIFGEIQLGAWFPRTTSVLMDINLGPIIRF